MVKKRPEAIVETGPDPYQIGLYGTVTELNEADLAAQVDLDIKKAAYEVSAIKTDEGTKIFGHRKYNRLSEAYNLAAVVPYQIHQKLYDGAFHAFLEGRPENLQEILANPARFRRYGWERPENILFDTIIELVRLKPDPLVPAGALKKIATDERPAILDETLHQVIRNKSKDSGLESIVFILLKAGARAKGTMLAVAIDRGAPQAVQDLLLKHGTSYQDALRVMRQNPASYSDGAADRLELAMTKEAKTHLENIMRTLTGEEPVQRLQGPQPGEAEVYTQRPREMRTKPIAL